MQTEILKLFYKRGDLVQFVAVRFRNNQPFTECVAGQVETEANGRAGWYYVRELHSGELHLLQWTDLMPAQA